MNNIEVEIRSFITKEQYGQLMEFFKKNAKLIKQDNQITYYFDCPQDLRIQKNNNCSKLWLKEGNMHDNYRKEIIIEFDKNQFENLEKLFLSLGMNIEIKWFRNRNQFDWNGIKVCIDYTKGYGYIIELEKMASENNKETVLKELKQKLKELNIKLTAKEEFDKKFKYYKENWRELINS